MKNSSDKFIEILKNLDPDGHGPNGLWNLNYSHWNNANFFKGHTFSYWYEGEMPNNVECLKAIQKAMIKYVKRLGQEKFEQGGWFASFEIPGVDLIVKFQVAGGPGSTPPKQ